MIDTIKRLKSIDSSNITVKRIVLALIRRITRIPHRLLYKLPWGWTLQNRIKLQALNNTHKGERCFIIANGPSLNKVDFNLLKDEFTIGMNRIYLMKEQNGFMPSCLMCEDERRLIIPYHKELDELDIPCFFPFYLRKYFSKKPNQYFVTGSFNPCFYNDATMPFGNGNTVTYSCIQLAYCLGFSEIYIIGKDHNFNVTGKAGTGVEVKGDDQNHFIKNYFQKGQKWDIPDFEVEEYAYSIAKKELEKNGVKIYNATIGGKLEVFERVDFYSLFPKK